MSKHDTWAYSATFTMAWPNSNLYALFVVDTSLAKQMLKQIGIKCE